MIWASFSDKRPASSGRRGRTHGRSPARIQTFMHNMEAGAEERRVRDPFGGLQCCAGTRSSSGAAATLQVLAGLHSSPTQQREALNRGMNSRPVAWPWATPKPRSGCAGQPNLAVTNLKLRSLAQEDSRGTGIFLSLGLVAKSSTVPATSDWSSPSRCRRSTGKRGPTRYLFLTAPWKKIMGTVGLSVPAWCLAPG